MRQIYGLRAQLRSFPAARRLLFSFAPRLRPRNDLFVRAISEYPKVGPLNVSALLPTNPGCDHILTRRPPRPHGPFVPPDCLCAGSGAIKKSNSLIIGKAFVPLCSIKENGRSTTQRHWHSL